MITMNFPWTNVSEARVKHLWLHEGLSASQIAKQINIEYREAHMLPVTRNSIIGKIHRMKLAKRVTSASIANKKPKPVPFEAPKLRERVMRTPKPKPTPAPAPDEAALPTFEHKLDTSTYDRLIHGPDCFAVYATLFSRVPGKQCCYPHPDADPRHGPMQVCGAAISKKREGEYCDHHKKLLGGGVATMIQQGDGLPKLPAKSGKPNQLSYMR